ncbi:MAG TPA: DUF4395 domain-containing protein [Candidatus Paceibacterota bacterium]|nr:DUF4395 domain-containing protein [Candidatus Paceibacterota bacterium]HMO82962.1 DUF4395 domain-containing protein [Candidatus Paceibacterota bacterium]
MTDLKKFGFFQYGQEIPNLKIHGVAAPYPVLNERAIRAGAGLMFAAGLFAFFHAFYLGDFVYIQVLVVLFFIDFLMKVVIGIRFSPISRLANLIVRGQKPEFVGAVQKRFAWSICLVLAATMIILLFVFEIRSTANLAICAVCLTFMFMESAFGICVGCKIYNTLLKYKLIKQPEYKPACPGNVCAIE